MKNLISKVPVCTLILIVFCYGIVFGTEAERVVQIYQVQTVRNPNDINAWVNLSRAYIQWARETLEFSKYDSALVAIQQAVSLDSINVNALNQLAKVKSANHKFKEIISIEKKALQYSPESAMAWGILGDAYLELGRYKEADSCYQKMNQLDKGLYTLARLSHLAFEKGDFQKAADLMKEAILSGEKENYPKIDLAWANVQLGELCLSRGEFDQALVSFEKSLQVLPDYLYGLEHKAEVLVLMGESSQAIEIYQKVTQKSSDPEFKSALAKLYLEVGKKKQSDSLVGLAKDRYEKYLESNLEAFNRHIAEFYLKWNINLEKALKLALKELEVRQDIHTYDLLAWAYFKNKGYYQAWENVSKALSQNTQDAKLLYHTAMIAKALGKKKESDLYYSKAEAINPQLEKMYSEK